MNVSRKHAVIMSPPLAYTIAEACTATRTGRTALYEAINSGQLRAVKRGRRTLVLAEDLRDWISRFPAIEITTADQSADSASR
jgi:excisionase family DNA binding protein